MNDTSWRLTQNIPLTNHGIFVSCTDPNLRLCYHRSRYDAYTLDRIVANKETVNIARGEDPRIFSYGKITYILNNRMNSTTLLQLNDKGGISRTIPILSPITKNAVPLIKRNKLVLIDFQARVAYITMIKEISVSMVQSWPINVTGGENFGCILRGGTPAVPYGDRWVGMGHCTRKGDRLRHMPFFWHTRDSVRFYVSKIRLPTANLIVDPTSLFVEQTRFSTTWKLITAESNKSWFSKQIYLNRVYEGKSNFSLVV